MRVKAIIAYDGSRFYGFQRQTTTDRTVAGALERVLGRLHIDSPVVGSGRTDRNVHATAQTVHFDLPHYWNDLTKLRHTLNAHLSYIRIRHIEAVDSEFHARFDACARRYLYRFTTRPPSPRMQAYVGYYPEGFDPDMLRKALSSFLGTRDFRFFHKSGSDPKTTVRTLYRASYRHIGAQHLITFTADGFLRAQVRMMVDAAMQTAYGNLTYRQLCEQRDTRYRHTHTLAPAQGLYLSKIYYDIKPLPT